MPASLLLISFASPAGLWLAAALPALVAIHLLRFRPANLVVPSTRLWAGAVVEPVANAPWQRIRDWPSLLLQSAALLLLALALSGPRIDLLSQRASNQVYFLDISASMATKSGADSNRLDAAKSWLRRRLSNARPGETFGLITFASDVQVLAPQGSPPIELLNKLDQISAVPESEAQGVWLSELLSAWRTNREYAAYTVLTGPVPAELLRDLPAGIGLFSFGDPLPNSGIAAVHLRSESSEWRLEAVPAHSGESTESRPPLLLERLVEQPSRSWRTVDARASDVGPVSFSLGDNLAAKGVWRVRVEQSDNFEWDNGVSVQVQPMDPAAVSIMPEGIEVPEALSRLLSALGADAGAALRLPGQIWLAGDSELPSGLGIGVGLPLSGRISYSDGPWWADLALEDLHLDEVRPLELTGTWVPLLMLNGQPVAAVRSVGKELTLVVSTDLLQDAQFKASDTFVTLVGKWYTGSHQAAFPRVHGPIADPSRPDSPFAMPLLSRWESEQPAQGEAFERESEVPELAAGPSGLPLAGWLIFLAFLLLAFEWTRFVRRTRLQSSSILDPNSTAPYRVAPHGERAT